MEVVGRGRDEAFDYQDYVSVTILVILMVNLLVVIIFDNFANEDADDNAKKILVILKWNFLVVIIFDNFANVNADDKW